MIGKIQFGYEGEYTLMALDDSQRARLASVEERALTAAVPQMKCYLLNEHGAVVGVGYITLSAPNLRSRSEPLLLGSHCKLEEEWLEK